MHFEFSNLCSTLKVVKTPMYTRESLMHTLAYSEYPTEMLNNVLYASREDYSLCPTISKSG